MADGKNDMGKFTIDSGERASCPRPKRPESYFNPATPLKSLDLKAVEVLKWSRSYALDPAFELRFWIEQSLPGTYFSVIACTFVEENRYYLQANTVAFHP